MSEIDQLPPNVQERIARLQQLQNMLQTLVAQKQRLEIELSETDRALKTLEGVTSGTKVYQSVGAILVEKPKEDVVKELGERKEFLEMRTKAMGKQEDKTRERLTALQQTLQKELNLQPGPIEP